MGSDELSREQRCVSCIYEGETPIAYCRYHKEPDGKGATGSESLRASMLNEAKDLVTGDRNNTYGPPHQDFSRTAGALTSLGYRGPDGRNVEAYDIAIFVGMVKISRLMWTPTKRDSWVDLAGYAACGYEAALEGTNGHPGVASELAAQNSTSDKSQ